MIHVYSSSNTSLEHVSIASKLAAEVLAANAAEVDTQGRFPAESLKALADAGLYGLCLPKEFGGKGEAMRAFAGVVEELSRACASTAMVYVMHVAAAQAIAASNTLGDRDSILNYLNARTETFNLGVGIDANDFVVDPNPEITLLL